MVTCLMTCQARRPPRWAPRHVPVGSSLSAVCRPKTADECVGPAVDPLEPSQDGRRGRRARSRSTRTVPRRPASVPSPQSIHSNRPKTAGECAEPAVDPLEPSQDGRRVCRARSRSTRTVPRRPASVPSPQSIHSNRPKTAEECVGSAVDTRAVLRQLERRSGLWGYREEQEGDKARLSSMPLTAEATT
jgi:hypothetical protein